MAGGGEGVGVEEAAGLGVIIAGLEVVKAGFLVVDIATVADLVILANQLIGLWCELGTGEPSPVLEISLVGIVVKTA